MKNRLLIYIFIIAVIGLLFWLWPKHGTIISQQSPETVQTNNQSPGGAVGGAIISRQAVPNTSLVSTSSTNSPPFVTNQPNVTEALERFVESRNKPIDFYGQFIDQNSNPIAGVDVTINVEQVTMPVGSFQGYVDSKYIPVAKTTDADGRFEIHNETGENFGFGIAPKDGYQLSPSAPRGPGRSASSYENPIIFRMWKEANKNKESLIGGSHVFGIDSGKIYTLNLITGKKFEGTAEGDLLVSITRPADAKPRTNFPWSFSIEAVQGGFVEADPSDEFMYIAPDSGYQPKIEMQFDPNDPAWTGIIKKRFFIRSRDGQIYGRAQIEIDSIYNVHSAVQIDYTVNPNGSQNLQP
jgi:hypothetical protein